MTTASALGQNGIWCPARNTSALVTKRNKCAKQTSPKMAPATRNPKTCEFTFVSFLSVEL
jgi:hypothetical protein